MTQATSKLSSFRQKPSQYSNSLTIPPTISLRFPNKPANPKEVHKSPLDVVQETPAQLDIDGKKEVHFDPDVIFQPTHTTCTPKLQQNILKYRAPEARQELQASLAPPSSVARPNYDDSLRRVSVVLYQHIRRCEARRQESYFPQATPKPKTPTKSRATSMLDSMTRIGQMFSSGQTLDVMEMFNESHFVSPQYQYTFVRFPSISPLTCFRMQQVETICKLPTIDQIYKFCRHLFNRAQLSAECSIVCLIYIERLMERQTLPLLGKNWKPIVLCGLLMASKVWQDLSSWNVEFSSIYPQFSLLNINRLERLFLQYIEWDLYISGSVYAKYYFALRSLTERKDFRRRYNYSRKVDPPNSKRLEERSAAVKNELYSKSL